MHAVQTGTMLAVRAGRLFDGERNVGPGTVLIDGGRVVDVHLAFDAGADVVTSIDGMGDGQLLTQMARAAR